MINPLAAEFIYQSIEQDQKYWQHHLHKGLQDGEKMSDVAHTVSFGPPSRRTHEGYTYKHTHKHTHTHTHTYTHIHTYEYTLRRMK